MCVSAKQYEYQCLTGTRYPTRPDNFWQYPIHTRFFPRIIGFFGYRVFHFFWPDVPVTVFKPHNICQVWTSQQSSLQRIQSMKSYKRDMGTAKFDIVHHFAYINSSFQEICSLVTHYALLSRFVVTFLPLFGVEKLLPTIVLLLW